jgi:hypothetical protein
MKEYNVPITNGMIVKHGSKARFTVKTGRTILEDRLVDVEILGGAFTTACIVYNRLSMSGGVDWWNPATGHSIERPKITMKVRKQDINAKRKVH